MKKSFCLALKSAVFTFVVILILIFSFEIFNMGRKSIYGREVLICLKNNAIYLDDGKTKYCVEPDRENLSKLINQIHQHPGVLPAPFRFMLISSLITSSFVG